MRKIQDLNTHPFDSTISVSKVRPFTMFPGKIYKKLLERTIVGKAEVYWENQHIPLFPAFHGAQVASAILHVGR